MDKAKQIFDLIAPFVKNGTILSRNYQQINDTIDDFITIIDQDKIIACSGLRTHQNISEIYCLAVDIKYQNQGISQQLLRKIEQTAKTTQLFALSKYKRDWFINNGFAEKLLNDLPRSIQATYNHHRRPKIFIKTL